MSNDRKETPRPCKINRDKDALMDRYTREKGLQIYAGIFGVSSIFLFVAIWLSGALAAAGQFYWIYIIVSAMPFIIGMALGSRLRR